MATQGPNSPSAALQIGQAGFDSVWAGGENVYTSNNVYATTTVPIGSSNTSAYLVAKNFGFSIPTDKIINSIQVDIEVKCTYNRLGSVALAKTTPYTTLVGYSDGVNVTSTEQYLTADTSTYGALWLVPPDFWTPEEINSNDFAVIFVANGSASGANTFSVDHIRVTVTYSDPTAVTETVASVTETIAVTTSTFDVSMANNNQAYILNRKTGYWTFQDTAPFVNALYRPSTQKVLASCRSLGQIVSFEGEHFGSIDIASIIQTGYMNLGEFDEIKAMEDKSSEAVKRLRAFFADCKGEGNLTLTIYTENDSTGETFTLTLGTTDNATLNAVRTALSRSLHGKYIAFKLTNASGNDFFIGETRMKILPKAIR